MNLNVLFNRATVSGAELRQGIDAFAHHVCAALSLRSISVEWTDDIGTAAINMHGNIKVANVRDDARFNNLTLRRYAGFIVHELLHRKYTDFSVRAPLGINVKYLNALYNAIEDAWIERNAIRSALLGNISDLLAGLVNGMVREAVSEVSDWSDPAQYPFSLAVFARGFCDRVPVPENLIPIWEEATRRVEHSTCSADNLAIAQWVMDQINQQGDDQPDDQPNDQPNDQPDDQGEQPGDDQPGEGQGEGQGEDQGTPSDLADGATGDDQGEGKGDTSDQKTNAPMRSRPLQAGQPARQVEPSAEVSEGGASGTYCGSMVLASANAHVGSVRWTISQTVPAKLRHEVRVLLDNSATTLFSPGRKSGSLNVRALHQYGQSDRLFQQRRDIDGIDSAVAIVLDVSGSMFPRKIEAAVNVCYAMLDALQVAQAATALITFGDEVSLQLPFAERHRNVTERLSRICQGGGTEDYAALRYAHDLLRARPESRKLCLVLTDGVGNAPAVREQCIAGESFGIVTIGMGMLVSADCYPRSVTIRKLNDLGRVSFGQIKAAA